MPSTQAVSVLDAQSLSRLARNLDREELLPDAACVYEALLRTGSATLESYLNLALVYLSAMDPSVQTRHGLSPDFTAFASVRFEEVVDEALGRWPDSVELWFWRRYAERMYRDGDCFLAECESRLAGSEEIVPCAYLAMARGEDRYAQQVRALRVLARVQLTARMRFVQRMTG